MKGAEPHAVQRSLPPTWGRIGGGVDERPGITKRPGLYLPWRSTMHALIPFLLLAAPAVPADRPSASARVTGVTAVTRADALGRSAGTAGAARSRKGIKACMVDLQGRYRPGLLVIPGRSSTPPPILPHVGGRERCTAGGSAPLRRSAGGVTSSAMAGRIDVNADLGESFGAWTMGTDEELMGLVSSANVACGFHAGDPVVMDLTVARAVQAGVALGAHPSHFDLRGFGRREIAASPHEVEADVIYQVGALAAFARSHGARLIHVKPHGALYNQAAVDQALAGAIARATARVDRELVLVGLASSATMRRAAEEAGLPYAAEAFADRAYEPDGSLRSRKIPGAVITDPEQAAAQALGIARDGLVRAASGAEVALRAETICLHGDNPHALAIARAVRRAFEAAGIEVRSLGR